MREVSIRLIDETWIEGCLKGHEDFGIRLSNATWSKTATLYDSVLVPWSSILFCVEKE